MTRINLLPWRETQRKERERRFASISLGSLALMAALIFYAHLHIGKLIDQQTVRNEFLSQQITVLDQQINEIKALESEKARLLARMGIIQELQRSRPESVHLVDELVTTLPEGVYYTQVRLQGSTLALEGVAQSNARVSQLMRNLENSPWLENPVLDVIKTSEEGEAEGRVSRYTLRVSQERAAKTPAAEPAPEKVATQ